MKRRKRIKQRSEKGKLLLECDSLFRQMVLRERENRCEWCGRTFRLQIAHILPKKDYPRLRYSQANILLLCFPCHPQKWHLNPLEAAEFIKRYKGERYKDDLKVLDATMPKLTMTYLRFLKVGLEDKLKEVKE